MTEPIIGVDISKDRLDAHRLPDGTVRQFPNTRSGRRAFLAWAGHDVNRIVYEPTGPYHRAFEAACRDADLPLCKINPLQARRFAEAIGTRAKTDQVDAVLLARMGLTLDLDPTPVAGKALRELKELRQVHQALIQERTRLRNRLKTLTVALVKQFHMQRLKRIELEINEVIDAIMARIESDPVMAQRFAILTSIPGLGTIATMTLIIEMPELGNLEAKQAASLAGLAPMIRQSGQWNGKARIIGGRKHLRDALFMPALVACHHNLDMAAKYQALTAAGKPAKVAITAVMRKLIVLANALVKADRKWQPKPA
ncbi:MAG: IS110 family transposase [Pseudomonadota bacterium]